jgi:uncharacterized protein YkwD
MGFARLLSQVLIIGGLLVFGAGNLLPIPECRAEGIFNPSNSQNLDSELNLEQELLTLTNQQRISQGLPELALDDKLMQIARNHSYGMAQQGFISHNQPSGDLKTRMNRAGYPYEVVRENVASANTISVAHNALLNSPPHKSNILAKDITRVGIGIARYQPPYDKQLYITEVFATPLDEYQPAMVQDFLTNRVDEIRNNGAGSMVQDPKFEEIASRSVQSLSFPYKREELRSLLAASATELQENGKTELSRLEVDVQLIRNPKKLSIPVLEREGQARMYGSAVRQVTDSENQNAFLVLTLIGITR